MTPAIYLYHFTFLGIPGLLDPVENTDPAESCLARGLWPGEGDGCPELLERLRPWRD